MFFIVFYLNNTKVFSRRGYSSNSEPKYFDERDAFYRYSRYLNF